MQALSTSEAAQLLSCSTSALYKLVARRKIPYRKQGKKIVFIRTELESLGRRPIRCSSPLGSREHRRARRPACCYPYGARTASLTRCRAMLQDPAIPLWLTEGQKKGDALASHGLRWWPASPRSC